MDAAEARASKACSSRHAPRGSPRRPVVERRSGRGGARWLVRSQIAPRARAGGRRALPRKTTSRCVANSRCVLRRQKKATQRDWVFRALEARSEIEEASGQSVSARRDREEALAILEEIAADLPRDLREVYVE